MGHILSSFLLKPMTFSQLFVNLIGSCQNPEPPPTQGGGGG